MILLLAGTAEARALALSLYKAGAPAVASLAGATKAPADHGLPIRTGGFGGEAGFRDYLARNDVRRVIDATHPFAARITDRTAQVCADLGLPYLQLLRPGWTEGPGDRWTWIEDETQAARHIPQGATVFAATGRQTLNRYGNLAGRRVILRQIEPPTEPFPFEGGEFLLSRPPFTLEAEIELFRALGVDWIVAKDAGGQQSRTKLDAARALGLPVLMIRRPAMPEAPRVSTVNAAMDWVRAR